LSTQFQVTDSTEPQRTEDQSYECGICLDDEILACDMVVKPCECAASYCKTCWHREMCTRPRCPSCRRSIGFGYDSEKREAKFLLYEKPESVGDGMILLPRYYTPGTAFEGQIIGRFHDKMHRRTRPALLKMLGEKGTGEAGARTCVCGGKNCFRRMTMEERRSKAWTPKSFSPFCDVCSKTYYECDENGQTRFDKEGITILIGSHIWSCERKSPVHLCGLDVCEDCMSQKQSTP